MVKHNLYDIDLIINKTITYGAIAAFITAIYVIVVVVIGAFIGVTEGVSLIATAVVAVAFQPIRRRAQQIANRLVYGERATPYEVLSRFSEQVGETYSGRTSWSGWRGSSPRARAPRRPSSGSGRRRVRPAATWPTNGAMATAIPRGRRASRGRRGDRVDTVRHQRELRRTHRHEAAQRAPVTGRGEARRRPGRPGRPRAGNSRLIEDLRASRQRLVAAQDEERRRLERNLHDGAQQLVALAVRLRLARTTASKDLAEADRMLEQLEGDVTAALRTSASSRGASTRRSWPTRAGGRDRGAGSTLTRTGARRGRRDRSLPAGAETAVYFCTLEALQNAAKYAQANEVAVSLLEDHGEPCSRSTTTAGVRPRRDTARRRPPEHGGSSGRAGRHAHRPLPLRRRHDHRGARARSDRVRRSSIDASRVNGAGRGVGDRSLSRAVQGLSSGFDVDDGASGILNITMSRARMPFSTTATGYVSK